MIHRGNLQMARGDRHLLMLYHEDFRHPETCRDSSRRNCSSVRPFRISACMWRLSFVRVESFPDAGSSHFRWLAVGWPKTFEVFCPADVGLDAWNTRPMLSTRCLGTAPARQARAYASSPVGGEVTSPNSRVPEAKLTLTIYDQICRVLSRKQCSLTLYTRLIHVLLLIMP